MTSAHGSIMGFVDRQNAEVVLDSREAIHAAAAELKTWSECKKITLRGCHLSTTTAATIVNILHKNEHRVEELVMDKCKGRVDIVLTVALTVATPKIVSVYLDYPPSIAFDSLAHSLGVGLLTTCSLEELNLNIGSNRGFFTLTSDAARSLEQGMSGNTSLSKLHIKNCRFAESSALRILAEGLRRMKGSLRDVRLAFCYEPNGQPLEDRNIACLIRALEDSCTLKRLDVSGNKCLDSGMQALASLVDKTQVKAMDVSSQQMDRSESMQTFSLVGALGRSLTLESLSLRSNNLSSDYDMACLAAALTHNTSIKHIDLSYNDISDSATNILSSKIPSMKVLKHLQMEGNPAGALGDDVSGNLVRAMKENMILTTVACDPELADYKTIRYYADLNWGGRGFLVQDSTRKNNITSHSTVGKNSCKGGNVSIPSSLWPVILSRIGRLSKSQERRANDRKVTYPRVYNHQLHHQLMVSQWLHPMPIFTGVEEVLWKLFFQVCDDPSMNFLS
eukprot:jgi/Psemu1/41855/gm1.41855_g